MIADDGMGDANFVQFSASTQFQGHHQLQTKRAIVVANFLWTDDLCTGNELIDGDHRRLINMVNALFDSMAKGHANEIISKVLHNLIIYTKEHFSREEAEMLRVRYAASISHKSEHTKLINQVAALKASLDAGEKINVMKVSSFLGDWLRNHILTADMKLAAALKSGTGAIA